MGIRPGLCRRRGAADHRSAPWTSGINLIDTAEVYGFGRSERAVGQAIAGRRDEAFIATKVAPAVPFDPVVHQRALASRRRLGIDRIDLYQAHWPNPVFPPGPLFEALARLQREGVVTHVGVSNYSLAGWQTAERLLGGPVLSNQVQYNLVDRRAEKDLVGWAHEHDRLIIAYSPLAQGLLSGGYSATKRPRGMRAVRPLFLPQNLDLAQDLLGGAAGRGRVTTAPRPSQVALAWVIRHPNVVVIPGASSVAQLESNAAAADLQLTDDEVDPARSGRGPVPALDGHRRHAGGGEDAVADLRPTAICGRRPGATGPDRGPPAPVMGTSTIDAMSGPDAISPLDGRYAPAVEAVRRRPVRGRPVPPAVRRGGRVAAAPGRRSRTSSSWPPIPPDAAAVLKGWVADFGPADVTRIKDIERAINHDVKAVEYYLKEKLAGHRLRAGGRVRAFRLHLRGHQQHRPRPHAPRRPGHRLATPSPTPWWTTCGRWPRPTPPWPCPATPTASRPRRPPSARSWPSSRPGGSGCWPPSDPCRCWPSSMAPSVPTAPTSPPIRKRIGSAMSRRFVESFGLAWNPLTTQIESHDALAEVFHAVVRFNAVLIDFCRDMWEYISRGYLQQRAVAGEVGSSTMPHKVNPIDFENAEANAGISSALLEHLASKLMISRMQRDLSDSSAIRNMGPPWATAAWPSAPPERGLARVSPAAGGDGRRARAAVGGPGRGHPDRHAPATGSPSPTSSSRRLTRGRAVSADDVHQFIRSLGLPAADEARLLALTPAGYVGLAAELVRAGRGSHP